jgi:hypothetical protein
MSVALKAHPVRSVEQRLERLLGPQEALDEFWVPCPR